MINSIPYSRNILVVAALLLTTVGIAQKKWVERFKADDATVLKLNTSYTHLIFETWNNNKIEIEATVEGENLTEKEKQEIFDAWDFSVNAANNEVVVVSRAKNNAIPLAGGMNVFKDMEVIDPFFAQMMQNGFPSVTNAGFPESFMKQMSELQFDYDAFRKDKEGYMKEFDKKLKAQMSANEASTSTSKNSQNTATDARSEMEQMNKMMEKTMREMESKFKNNGMNYTQKVVTDENGNKTYILQGSSNGTTNTNLLNAKKTLRIKMPKDTKTEINVRHGEIKMADASNVRATLNYSPFTANTIDGGQTFITAAYAPVVINNWESGTLYVKFVDNCDLKNVEEINLKSNSSGVFIGRIGKYAKISAAFGALRIDEIEKNYNTLDLILENTNAVVNVPTSSFNVTFNGKRSSLRYKKDIELQSKRQFDRVLVTGYHKAKDSQREMMISAAYSNLILQ